MNRLTGRFAAWMILLALGGVSQAAQQFKSTRVFFLKSPGPTGDNLNRRGLFKSKEGPGSANTIAGNPTVHGAKLHVKMGNGSEQCFDLPAANWSPISSFGYHYTSFAGPGAVTAASIKKTPSGVFIMKLRLSGKVGPVDVVPQAGTTRFDLNLSLGGGDQYCAGGPTPPGATNTDKTYRAQNLPAPTSCGIAACSPSGAFLDPDATF
jgi:hypothetical protein